MNSVGQPVGEHSGSENEVVPTEGRARRAGGGGKRRRAREMALQMLYQQELGNGSLTEVFACFNLDDFLAETDNMAAERKMTSGLRRRLETSFIYAQELVAGTIEHSDELNRLIRERAENWRLERMPSIDRNILRVALYEMLYQQEVPKVVIVDEAIELAKRFGSESSGRFVNGLLDGILKAEATPASTMGSPT